MKNRATKDSRYRDEENHRIGRLVAFLLEEEIDRKVGDKYFQSLSGRFRQRLQASLVQEPTLPERFLRWWAVHAGHMVLWPSRARWAMSIAMVLLSLLGVARWKEARVKGTFLAGSNLSSTPARVETQLVTPARNRAPSVALPPVAPRVIPRPEAEYVFTGASETYDPTVAF